KNKKKNTYTTFKNFLYLASSYAVKHEYGLFPQHEMYAHGIINLIGGLFGTWPGGGVITHAPLADQAGSKTLMFVWICAGITIVMMIVISQVPYLVYWLPKGVLAGIVYSACIGMFPFQKIKELFLVDTKDSYIALITLVCTTVWGIFEGIQVGVALSIIFLVQRSSKPHCAVIGRISQSRAYGSIRTWTDAITTPGIIIFRFDGALYFGNTEFFKRAVQALVQRHRRLNKPVYYFILDCHAVNDLDSSGVLAIDNVVKYFKQNRILFILTGIKYPVLKLIKRSHLKSLLDHQHIFYNVFQAHMYIYCRTLIANGAITDNNEESFPKDYVTEHGVNLIQFDNIDLDALEKPLNEAQKQSMKKWHGQEAMINVHPLEKVKKGFQLGRTIRKVQKKNKKIKK
ncbi:sulfate permease, partial [Reticulomyxa filosa]